MGRRLVGCLLFVGTAVFLFDLAGRLASEQRAGWGWFLIAGLMISGIALNLWTAEDSTPWCPHCRKNDLSHDLE